jgi:long-chain acyl-CoA synthetase
MVDDVQPGEGAAPWLTSYPEGIDWQLAPEERSLGTLLDDAVATWPERSFLEFLGRSWTYAEIGRLVERATAGFQAIGVRRGTRVGFLLPNCPYYPICYFAVLRAGGTVVNYNPLYTPLEIERQVADSATEIMVTLDLETLLPKLDGLIGRTPLRRIVVGRMADVLPFPKSMLFPLVKRREIARNDRGPATIGFHELIRTETLPHVAEEIDPLRDVAVVQYTGGTTGVAKGALLTHAALATNARQLVLWNRMAAPAGDRILAVLPLFHVFALTVVLNYGAAVGAELILLPRFEMAQLLKAIERKRPTILPGVPTLYTAINTHPRIERRDLTSLRLCISGGAPLPLEVMERFEALTGCPVVEGYGLTESPVVTCNPIGGRRKPGSVGLPLPGARLEIRSLDDPKTLQPLGEKGEICVGGPQNMTAYHRAAGPLDEVVDDGLLRTGDIGRVDPEGYLFVVDRLKEVIICSGFNVWPRMVEEALYQHPAVAEAAVVGIDDERRGQTVKAFVVRRDGMALDAPDLLEFLSSRLSPIEMPKLIEFRDDLPKSTIGKVLKRKLTDRAAEPGADAAATKGAAA